MKKTGLILITLTLAFTAACGSNRPDQDEVSKSLTSKSSAQSKALPKKQADCVADILVKSDLSDKTLVAVVEQDKTYKGTKKEQKVLTGLGTTITKKCLGQ